MGRMAAHKAAAPRDGHIKKRPPFLSNVAASRAASGPSICSCVHCSITAMCRPSGSISNYTHFT